MGLRAAMSLFTSVRPIVAALAPLVLGSMTWAVAGDDESVVVHLVAYLNTVDFEGGEIQYEFGFDPSADPAVEILPCYPTNQPFLGAADDPVLVAQLGPTTIFERQWRDPSRFLIEPPDDGGDEPFTPPSQVAFQLTLPWTNEFDTLFFYPDPAAAETGSPVLEVDLSSAISLYLELRGRDQTDVICQHPETLDALRQEVDTEARIDEALKEIGEVDPR